jgi:hypothetical protein
MLVSSPVCRRATEQRPRHRQRELLPSCSRMIPLCSAVPPDSACGRERAFARQSRPIRRSLLAWWRPGTRPRYGASSRRRTVASIHNGNSRALPITRCGPAAQRAPINAAPTNPLTRTSTPMLRRGRRFARRRLLSAAIDARPTDHARFRWLLGGVVGRRLHSARADSSRLRISQRAGTPVSPTALRCNAVPPSKCATHSERRRGDRTIAAFCGRTILTRTSE